MFVVAAAEALPDELTGVADAVTVYFPWASLLRGLVTADGRVLLSNVAALCRPGGTFEAMWSVVDRDLSVAGMGADDGIAARFAGAGLRVVELRPPTPHEIDETRSTWAKRLRRDEARKRARARRRPGRPDRLGRQEVAVAQRAQGADRLGRGDGQVDRDDLAAARPGEDLATGIRRRRRRRGDGLDLAGLDPADQLGIGAAHQISRVTPRILARSPVSPR